MKIIKVLYFLNMLTILIYASNPSSEKEDSPADLFPSVQLETLTSLHKEVITYKRQVDRLEQALAKKRSSEQMHAIALVSQLEDQEPARAQAAALVSHQEPVRTAQSVDAQDDKNYRSAKSFQGLWRKFSSMRSSLSSFSNSSQVAESDDHEVVDQARLDKMHKKIARCMMRLSAIAREQHFSFPSDLEDNTILFDPVIDSNEQAVAAKRATTFLKANSGCFREDEELQEELQYRRSLDKDGVCLRVSDTESLSTGKLRLEIPKRLSWRYKKTKPFAAVATAAAAAAASSEHTYFGQNMSDSDDSSSSSSLSSEDEADLHAQVSKKNKKDVQRKLSSESEFLKAEIDELDEIQQKLREQAS